MDDYTEESEDVILVQKLKSFMHKEARGGQPSRAFVCQKFYYRFSLIGVKLIIWLYSCSLMIPSFLKTYV